MRFFDRRPRRSSPIDRRLIYGEEKRQVEWGQTRTFWSRACKDIRSLLAGRRVNRNRPQKK